MCKMIPDQSDDVLSVTASDLKKLTMESRLFLICYSTKVFDSHQGESGYIRKERDEHFLNIVYFSLFLFIKPKSNHCLALSLSQSPCWILLKLLDLSGLSDRSLLHGFVKIDEWISLSCFMDLSKLQNGFVALYQTKPSWGLTKI